MQCKLNLLDAWKVRRFEVGVGSFFSFLKSSKNETLEENEEGVYINNKYKRGSEFKGTYCKNKKNSIAF